MDSSLDGVTDPLAGKEKNRSGYTVSFPTLPSLTAVPIAVEIRQKAYSHDIVRLHFPTTSPIWVDDLQTGVPIKVSWRQGDHWVDWFGYVDFVKSLAASQNSRPMDVFCIGSTFPLKERSNRVFTSTSIPEAVETIAGEFGFNFIGDTHSRRFSQLTMAGHSYWEWLVEQAKRIGFVVYVDGVNLYFRDTIALVNQQSTSVPILSLGVSFLASAAQHKTPTLSSFDSIKGDYVETGDARTTKFSAGVDPITMLPHAVSASPADYDNLRSSPGDVLFSEYRSAEVTGDSYDARSTSNALAQNARLSVPAKTKGQGDPRLHPWQPVFVTGTGAVTDGYWVVREVVHHLQRNGAYTAEMTVVTDGTGSSSPSPFRNTAVSQLNVVNVASALAQASSDGVGVPATAVLQSYMQVPSTFEQGFLRTPTRWVAS